MNILDKLRIANLERAKEWDPNNLLDSSFFGNELGGEVGEAQNVIKKLERERLDIKGSRDTVEHLAEELADVIIVIDIIASRYNIDLESSVKAKFNATSIKLGFSTLIS